MPAGRDRGAIAAVRIRRAPRATQPGAYAEDGRRQGCSRAVLFSGPAGRSRSRIVGNDDASRGVVTVRRNRLRRFPACRRRATVASEPHLERRRSSRAGRRFELRGERQRTRRSSSRARSAMTIGARTPGGDGVDECDRAAEQRRIRADPAVSAARCRAPGRRRRTTMEWRDPRAGPGARPYLASRVSGPSGGRSGACSSAARAHEPTARAAPRRVSSSRPRTARAGAEFRADRQVMREFAFAALAHFARRGDADQRRLRRVLTQRRRSLPAKQGAEQSSAVPSCAISCSICCGSRTGGALRNRNRIDRSDEQDRCPRARMWNAAPEPRHDRHKRCVRASAFACGQSARRSPRQSGYPRAVIRGARRRDVRLVGLRVEALELPLGLVLLRREIPRAAGSRSTRYLAPYSSPRAAAASPRFRPADCFSERPPP